MSLAELWRPYGAAWQITVHSELPVWTAEHRNADGRYIRILVAHSLAELGIKLETAGTVRAMTKRLVQTRAKCTGRCVRAS